jgi:hypothetical protein
MLTHGGSVPALNRDPEGAGGSAVGYGAVGDFDELVAAAAHLDGDVAEGGSLEFEAGGLAMVGAAEVANFALGSFLELPYGIGEHEIILA